MPDSLSRVTGGAAALRARSDPYHAACCALRHAVHLCTLLANQARRLQFHSVFHDDLSFMMICPLHTAREPGTGGGAAKRIYNKAHLDCANQPSAEEQWIIENARRRKEDRSLLSHFLRAVT